jgi:hypothetical protein
MSDWTITIHEVKFHRNGVGGAPFYTARFDLAEEGETATDLIAIFYDPRTGAEAGPWSERDELFGATAIIDPLNLSSSWRGDRLHDDVVLAARVHPDGKAASLAETVEDLLNAEEGSEVDFNFYRDGDLERELVEDLLNAEEAEEPWE